MSTYLVQVELYGIIDTMIPYCIVLYQHNKWR